MKNMNKAAVLWTALILALVVIAVTSQIGSALPTRNGLEPPLKFVERPQTYAPGVSYVPAASQIIMTETFGTSFAPTTTLSGVEPLWRVMVNPDDSAGYYWDRVTTGTYADSVWHATKPITSASPLVPGSDRYPDGQDTWLLYGPVNLSDVQYVQLTLQYSMTAAPKDLLMWGISTDGQTFYGNQQSGSTSSWVTNTYSLKLERQGNNSAAYIAFAFKSGTSANGLGAFIRNVKLAGEPFKLVYLPLTLLNYPPTPTPVPPLYGYTFDQGDTDLTHWGGAYYNPGTTKYGQCIPGQCTPLHPTTAHGNPTNSLRLYTNGLYSFIASSPNDITPDNYDLYVDISPWVIYPKGACSPYGCPSNDLGDWYGIIFNASNDTFGANPSQFAYNKTFYRVYFYNVDSVKPITIRLDRCDGGSGAGDNSCHKLGSSSLPSNFIGNASGFDTVHIQRLASGSINVWLNGSLLITATDATYTGASHGKYGVFIFSWTRNATQNPPTGYEMQVDFDNILVRQP